MLTALFVAARIIANPIANVFQKQLARRSANPLFIIGVTHALLTLAVVPLLLLCAWRDLSGSFWANMSVSALLAVGGNVLLVYALKSTDLSILGPVNAYKSVISLVLAVFLVGEVPTPAGVAGVLLIVAGSYFVVDRDAHQPSHNAFVRFFRERGVQFRLSALALSATEAVFLKRALLLSSPLTTFVFWSILGFPIAALAIVLLLGSQRESQLARFQGDWAVYVRLAVVTGVMQLATLFTFGKLQVGYSLALFQLSTLVSVFLGYRYFHERNIPRRLLGSLVMIAGSILIVVVGLRS